VGGFLLTIEQLENCRSAKGEIESLRERIERIKSDRERMTQSITGMPSGKNNNQSRIEELTAKLMELEEQLADKLWQRETEIKEVEAWIETLKPYQRNVIRLRYIEGRTWRQVQRRTHYSKDGVLFINRSILKSLNQTKPKTVE
jgi:DNA-directed RNA polymerase specialized sigma24 family protein